jgi:hypothetical protein
LSEDILEGEDKVEFLKFPEGVEVKFIGEEADVPLLEALLNDGPWIGIDTEWKPNLCKYHDSPVATLQVSGEKHAFVIDMLKLASS